MRNVYGDELIGERFGRLVVVSRGTTSYGRPGYVCSCDCGGTVTTTGHKLTSGHTRSCGCFMRETMLENIKPVITHGMSRTGRKTRIYRIWSSMRTRCNNRNSEHYVYYGKRGIRVCDEWNDFMNFYNWAIQNGYRENLTIDRIDVNGGYSPDNCRWATILQQNENRRCSIWIQYDGKKRTIMQISELTGIKYSDLYNHYRSGDFFEYVATHKK